ncbi:MAG TPA: SMI1/KNR4 family protein [Blastocatellia bacterium]|nr:SMI1/KNR4 family protein [Blastocatellia bacterium]
MTEMQLQKLIDDLTEALRERDRLVFDEENPHELGRPSSPQQLSTLEQILGKPLPPSYAAFLKLHNGWDKFVGGAKLLAIEDQESKWVKKRVDDLDTLFYEDQEVENPFTAGAIPVLLGEDERTFLVLDPRTVRPNGEMDFIQFYLIKEEQRFADFTSFLQHKLNILHEMIDDEKEGLTEDDEDDLEE